MKKKLIYGIIVLLILCFGTLIVENLPKKNENPSFLPIFQTQPSNLPNPTPLDLSSREKSAALSKSYPFTEIDKLLRKDRTQIALCLLKDPEFKGVRIQLNLDWHGSGALRKIDLTPSPNKNATACIYNLIYHWNLMPHPGLQPFTYRAILVPSGF